MIARQKLNGAYLNGSLVLATVAGLGSESWLVFLLALVTLLAGNVGIGAIRPRPQNHRHRRHHPVPRARGEADEAP